MTSMKYPTLNNWMSLIFLAATLFSCSGEEDTREVELFDPPVLDASVSSHTTQAGEAVTFIDNSKKVHKRLWSFKDATEVVYESDAIVHVSYKYGGEYITKLTVTFIDNSVQEQQDTIIVEGNPMPVDPVITGDTYGVYTEHNNVTAGKPVDFQSANQFVIKETTETFHGDKAKAYVVDGTGAGAKTFAFGIVIFSASATDNLSAFADGYLNVALRSTSADNLRVRIRGNGGLNDWVTLTAAGEEYGFKRDGNWHMISIPVADIFNTQHPGITAEQRATFLSQVKEPFMLRSDDVADITALPGGFNFDVDNIYYSENLPQY
jgi:hypothetical protein